LLTAQSSTEVPAEPVNPAVPIQPDVAPSKDKTTGGGGSNSSSGGSGKSGGSHRVRSGSSDEQIPLVTFDDMNRDGMMDIVFGFEDKIYVYYNLLDHKEFDPESLDVVYLCLHW
tara:strand:+ start:1080 stop:1421 length:342 start_codon:yes stop_codon:yes gene_type:complete